ncbi:glycosyl transferase family 1 [Motilibacter peucedani]|uniref:Glycosyl transferase family 1 n=1 Tax=Motilibacter peucedani TaxID=598650 RepID=A0A420XTX9_9ACTN|nr:glycosyltransferase [Motilibacter peucedani]RKS80217.1 glycosyl transferase family 1 [Motilibacter peucedani]
MRILLWHVHGSWATAFLQGRHDYVLPVLPDRGPDGLGRARTWDWPASVVELPPERLAEPRPDVVVLQRPHEAALLEQWTGLRAGVDVPAVYVEHNTPEGDVTGMRHHLAGQTRVPVVHVTEFNRMMWDNGSVPTRVVEHGVLDPGPIWTGEVPRLSMSVNEPVRRWRVAGMDLAAAVAGSVPVDVYGMGTDALVDREPAFASGLHENLTQAGLHLRMASHRAYLHTYRWTSLGLSLLEAMVLGSPVLVLAATAAPEAVPAGAGLVSSDVRALAGAARDLLADPAAAAQAGKLAREHVLAHFSLERFLADWDALLAEVV